MCGSLNKRDISKRDGTEAFRLFPSGRGSYPDVTILILC